MNNVTTLMFMFKACLHSFILLTAMHLYLNGGQDVCIMHQADIK